MTLSDHYAKLRDPELREWAEYISWRLHCVEGRLAVGLVDAEQAEAFYKLALSVAQRRIRNLPKPPTETRP